ncbi:cysteine hydrolase family protein [Chitinimonas sp.]|uniref:cysteine hydrolase family protein n=1 Tax=Chitinimonas sp. TaxID=1934313 RepID=UPI002F929E6D
MSAALLVIDVQESFRHAPYWQDMELPAYLDRQNRLIAAARQAGVPVVRVFHVDLVGFPHFSRESGYIVPLAGSDDYADHTVEKHVHSAMVDTGLPDWLAERGVQRLIVSGIRTEQCCETTTRHAADLGFAVDYISDATLTFPMQHANGRCYTTDELRERTELVLAGRFARIRSTAEMVAELSEE